MLCNWIGTLLLSATGLEKMSHLPFFTPDVYPCKIILSHRGSEVFDTSESRNGFGNCEKNTNIETRILTEKSAPIKTRDLKRFTFKQNQLTVN